MDHDQSVIAQSQVNKVKLKRTVAVRLVFALVILGLMFFWPAGTFSYWQAWTYIVIMFAFMLGAFAYFIRKDPELLERRMRAKEKERRQILITSLGTPVFLGIFLLPGFDRRYGWSSVPVIVVIAADILVLAGYALFVRVLKENSYASRIVEVEEKQKVITTGPYAMVRHPMYVAVMIMFGLTPLALGSYWAVVPALSLILVLVARIKNEEKVLVDELAGYREYMQRVKFRLIPGIW
jgi:protein-S-isoprenylcysteine O-methyltransferase Ste14